MFNAFVFRSYEQMNALENLRPYVHPLFTVCRQNYVQHSAYSNHPL